MEKKIGDQEIVFELPSMCVPSMLDHINSGKPESWEKSQASCLASSSVGGLMYLGTKCL